MRIASRLRIALLRPNHCKPLREAAVRTRPSAGDGFDVPTNGVMSGVAPQERVADPDHPGAWTTQAQLAVRAEGGVDPIRSQADAYLQRHGPLSDVERAAVEKRLHRMLHDSRGNEHLAKDAMALGLDAGQLFALQEQARRGLLPRPDLTASDVAVLQALARRQSR